MRKDMQVQIDKIMIDKWNEGCRIKQDPGKEFILRWIEHEGYKFREDWIKSLCKNCKKWKKCGYKLERKCSEFLKEA